MQKSILITGSTDGIGKLAALKMATEGHHLYLHGRNASKLTSVISEIKQASGNHQIEGFVADFADLNAVRTMSNEINTKISSLDILINNAGIFKAHETITSEGRDIRIVVNYYAPYLMTHNILDTLKASPAARVINLSSAAQSSVSMELLSGDIQVSDQEAYAQSKFAILMWSFHMSKTMEDISVLALNPGSLLNTNMVREAYGKFWSPADKGADIIYDMALNKSAEEIDGKYFDNDSGTFNKAHPDAYDTDFINALINKTEEEITR